MFADAEAYERFMGRWSRVVAPRLVDFTGVPDRGRLLEVGSATGSLAYAIVERKVHTHVVGIDPSREYIAYAASKNPSPDRVNFEVGDAQELQFPTQASIAPCPYSCSISSPTRRKHCQNFAA